MRCFNDTQRLARGRIERFTESLDSDYDPIRRMAKTATPFGAATLVERVALAQRAGERRFRSVVELLSQGGQVFDAAKEVG